jgi:hypothetical protein
MVKRLLLIVVPLVLVCALLEVVLRTAHPFGARVSWTEPDREIGWRFTPGREYWFFGENDHAITGRINSMGWRDRERSPEKPPGTYRIAVIGDSYVEAFQVELDSTFAALAEAAYRGSPVSGSETVEVMNIGRSGMGPAEELVVLARLIRSRPDRVLLLFTPHNDIADVNPATASNLCRPFLYHREDGLAWDTSFTRRRDFRIREAINPLKQHSALFSLIAERYNSWRLARAMERTAAEPGGLTREQSLCTDEPDSVFARNYALCKLAIARMARMCQTNGIRFELACVPLAYRPEDVEHLRSVDASFDPEFFDRDLAALADSSGFSFTPLTADFALRSRRGVKLQWQHWNYAGHRAAFRRLLDPAAAPRGPGASPTD